MFNIYCGTDPLQYSMAVIFSLVLIPFILFFVRGNIYEIPHKNIVDIRTIAEHIEQDVAELKEVLANSTQGQTVKKQGKSILYPLLCYLFYSFSSSWITENNY